MSTQPKIEEKTKKIGFSYPKEKKEKRNSGGILIRMFRDDTA